MRVSLASRCPRFRCAVWACVLGPGLGCAPPFLAGLSGCVFCACFFFLLYGVGCWVSPSRALWSVPLSPFFRAGLLAFFFSWCVSACFGAPFPDGPLFLAWCCRFWLDGPPVPLWGSCLRCLLGGGFGRLLCFWRAVWWLWAVFAPPPLFFFWGEGGCLFLPLPFLGWRTHCGRCVVRLVPRHSWRRFLRATPRHSWLGFAAGGGGRSSPLLAEGPGCGSPPLLAGVRLRRWCVVCGGGVLVGLWLVCGVVGPSPLLAEVPVCYSPPLLAGFCCRWWWVFLATPGGGSWARFPATPGWGPLAAVVCGVWRWCVGGVVASVW